MLIDVYEFRRMHGSGSGEGMAFVRVPHPLRVGVKPRRWVLFHLLAAVFAFPHGCQLWPARLL